MAGDPPQRLHGATITTTDPLGSPAHGTSIRVSSLEISRIQAEAFPLAVENYEYFDGALLAVCIQYGNEYRIEGTAVMIGMGLAISASHIFDDHRDALNKGHAVLLCIGIRAGGAMEIWHCYSMVMDGSNGDLQLLCLKLSSDFPADGHFRVVPLTSRIPRNGETLTVVGFQFQKEWVSMESLENPTALDGQMYVSQGAAGDFSFPIHDTVLAPYPTIEVLSGTFGGMSGGAVLDVNGAVVGIISRGWDTDDKSGPSLAAWWLPAFFWQPQLTWPNGFHEEDAAVSEMLTVCVAGREHITVNPDGSFVVTHWTD